MSWRIGIDLGGTKVEGLLLDESGTERWRERLPTPQGDYDGTIAAIKTLVTRASEHAQANAGECLVGIGHPGSVSPSTGLHRNANSTCLNGCDLKQDLEAALGRAVSMANDANCLALSEAVDGAGADGRIVFAVILGTGCGGGLAIDKHVIEGRNGVGGEWGHIPLPRRGGEGWPSRPCYCGLTDCLEQYLSGPAIQQEHLERSGQSMRVTDIAQSATRGDDAALETLALFHDRFANALAVVVNILDPDVFVLGGGVSNLPGLAETVQPMLAERVFGGECVTPIRVAKHGDSSGVRGAAWL